ncbi:Mu transposase C-terminal domain-containing protein [Mesobacillus jeotgali]|uniref:Mu transposase C-terminal domain-containing protein n=1 Tax=Mesobacillus jeotgali TaxID=129985 RepID=A0ABY9VJ33_9BACI|nr:Mu transposase C-terminal domain-containing protein [Mesobacillus jeotgali]WNF23159.1 Mu transposase C-terminal domain-containing protein [Mesobacillus jeotgali]
MKEIMETLSVNELIVDLDLERNYRVLWVDSGNIIAYVIDIEKDKALPFIMTIKHIEEKIYLGEYTIKVDRGFILNRKPTKKDLEHRDKTWIYIKDLVDHKPGIFKKDQRNKIIDKVMSSHTIGSRNTVLKNLRKYWQRGMDKDSLFPNHALKRSENNYKTKTGRPKKNGKTGIVITQDIKNQFKKSIEKYYLDRKKPSLRFAFNNMTSDYYSKYKYFDKEGNEKIKLVEEEKRPTFRQFQYWFRKEYFSDDVTKAREGKHIFEQNYRAITGSSTAETDGPGDIFQIDATPSNAYLVSRFNPNWIVGRPTTYFIVDVNTHLITGLYVGLENASWKAMMNAILNACSDKVEFCKKYDIDITSDMWPSMHLPSNIIGDRGELASHGVDHLVEGLGPLISNTPPYRPDWKGIVEKLFDTSQEKIKPFIPGYVHKDHGERGVKDYRLEATLTIEDYTKVLIHFILFYNQNFYMDDYIRTEEQIGDNVQPIPIKLWEWGIKNAAGKLHKHNIEKIKFYLLPRATATVTEKGIKYKKMLYTTPVAIKEGWFSRARLKGSWKVEFSFDPRNMDTIYIHSNDKDLFIPCNFVDHHSRYKNKTIEEIEQLIEFESDDKKNFEHTQLENEINFYSDIQGIVKAAEKNKKEHLDKSLSKAARTKNIKGYRKQEQLERSFEESIKPSTEEEIVSSTTDKDNVVESFVNQPMDNQESDGTLHSKVSIKQLFAKRGRKENG